MVSGLDCSSMSVCPRSLKYSLYSFSVFSPMYVYATLLCHIEGVNVIHLGLIIRNLHLNKSISNQAEFGTRGKKIAHIGN